MKEKVVANNSIRITNLAWFLCAITTFAWIFSTYAPLRRTFVFSKFGVKIELSSHRTCFAWYRITSNSAALHLPDELPRGLWDKITQHSTAPPEATFIYDEKSWDKTPRIPTPIGEVDEGCYRFLGFEYYPTFNSPFIGNGRFIHRVSIPFWFPSIVFFLSSYYYLKRVIKWRQ